MTSDEDSANEYWDPRGKKIVKKFKEDAVKVRQEIKVKLSSAKIDYKNYSSAIQESDLQLKEKMEEMAKGENDINVEMK